VGINATVVPPSPPPVNPAPPSGSAARKEAKQRQAATAKSEEGGGESQAGVDLAQGANKTDGTQMTRLDQRHPYTRSQPSALARDVLYGGGLGVAALVLALGFSIVRPTPRRRTTSTAAPAWSRLPRR
jgi:hypothetical protein